MFFRSVGRSLSHTFSGAALFLVIAITPYLAAQPQYTIHDLGAGIGEANGPNSGITLAINNKGEVAGCISVAGNNHAFRTAPNAPVNLATDDLGTLGGTSSCALGLNASGQVVGYSTAADGQIHGFRTAPEAAIHPATDDIGFLAAYPTYARAINDSGQVTGDSASATTFRAPSHAFRTAPNSAINPATDDLEASPGFFPHAYMSRGYGINAAGDVAGIYLVAQSYEIVFVAQGGTFSDGITQFYIDQGASGINDHGQIAFNLGTPGLSVWQNGTITQLAGACLDARTACVPIGINNSLQAVGQKTILPDTLSAFLFSGGTLYDLNNLIPAGSGWVLTTASAINDSGQIVGTGTLDGVFHAFRLDPACARPSITDVSASPSSIWPPDRQLVPVNVFYNVSSSCEANNSLSVTVSSALGERREEISHRRFAPRSGTLHLLGEDQPVPAWIVVDPHSVELRADRDAIYTITITSTNTAGTSTASVQVPVRHDGDGQ